METYTASAEDRGRHYEATLTKDGSTCREVVTHKGLVVHDESFPARYLGQADLGVYIKKVCESVAWRDAKQFKNITGTP